MATSFLDLESFPNPSKLAALYQECYPRVGGQNGVTNVTPDAEPVLPARGRAELPTKFPGTNRAKLSEYVLPWLDLLAWTQMETGESIDMPQRTVASRISRFCKTGESAKSAKAEGEDPDDEKSGPDPYQMVRAGTAWPQAGRGRDATP